MHLTCWRGRRGHTAHWALRQAAGMKGTEECKGCVCVGGGRRKREHTSEGQEADCRVLNRKTSKCA